MTERTRIVWNIREGESMSLGGGRVVFTLLKRSGKAARILIELPADETFEKPRVRSPEPAETPG